MNKPIFRCFFVLVLTLSTIPLAAYYQVPNSTDGILTGTYGNKVVRDNYNNLHIAYATAQGGLRYRKGNIDGTIWSPQFVYPSIELNGFFNVANPALDVDSWNNVGIVFTHVIGNGSTGDLVYFYPDPNTSNQWTYMTIANNASQPSIAIRKGVAHVAWIHDRTVKYMAFPANTPPFAGSGNEQSVAQTTCNYSGFSKPSISLIHDNCDPDTPVIGYHYFSDEIVQVGLQCPYMGTRVGPQVKLFDNATQSWSLIYSDVRNVTGPNNLPRLEMTSLSLNACWKSGSIYLAYADILDGDGRTKLAIGNRTTWHDVDLDPNQAMPIDMVANHHYNGGEFRVAWQNGGNSYYRSGQWEPYQTAPAWIETSPQVIGSGNINHAPQAIFAKYCNPGNQNIHSFSEVHFGNLLLGITFDTNLDICNNVDYDVLPPCTQFRIYVDKGDQAIYVSFAEAGGIFEPPTADSVTFMSGRDRYVIRWESGELENYWYNGFKLNGGSEIYVEPPAGQEAPEIVILP